MRTRVILAAIAATSAVSSLTVGCTAQSTASSPAPGTVNCSYHTAGTASRTVTPPASTNVPATGTVSYVMKLNSGEVVLTLDRAAAPCAVNSFISLAQQGFYDNTPCHRLGTAVPFQFLQCGDPDGNGAGGSGYEFDNESTGTETYPAGTLAMANKLQPGTQGSQFFLTFGDSAFAPDYTVFGRTDSAGVAVLKKAAAAGSDNKDGNGVGFPLTPITISAVTPR